MPDEERTRIVKWLRQQEELWRSRVGTGDAKFGDFCWGGWNALAEAAEAIERGDHAKDS